MDRYVFFRVAYELVRKTSLASLRFNSKNQNAISIKKPKLTKNQNPKPEYIHSYPLGTEPVTPILLCDQNSIRSPNPFRILSDIYSAARLVSSSYFTGTVLYVGQ